MHSEQESSFTLNIEKPKNKFSWKEGVDLYLLYEQTRVCVNVSSWSGYENIYVNGERLFRRWNLFCRKSSYQFSDAGFNFKLLVCVESFLKGVISATLYVQDRQVDYEKLILEDWFEKNKTP